jgi:hypothetical protein
MCRVAQARRCRSISTGAEKPGLATGFIRERVGNCVTTLEKTIAPNEMEEQTESRGLRIRWPEISCTWPKYLSPHHQKLH